MSEHGNGPGDVERPSFLAAVSNVKDMDDAVRIVQRYGYLPPAIAIGIHGLFRGVFEFVSDPYVMADGYVFSGWPVALGINLFYGVALVLFSWFLFFGLVGVVAGYLSDERIMSTELFLLGGYLLFPFVPVFAVGSILMLTVSAPDISVEAAHSGTETLEETPVEIYRHVYNSWQMGVVRAARAATWLLVGFLVLPGVQRCYGLSKKRTVAAVLPMTLIAMIGTALV